MAPDGTNANRLAHLLYVLALLVGWVGAMVLAINLRPRYTAQTFAGTPLDASAWVGLVLLGAFLPLVYAGNTVGKRYGTYPPDRGWF